MRHVLRLEGNEPESYWDMTERMLEWLGEKRCWVCCYDIAVDDADVHVRADSQLAVVDDAIGMVVNQAGEGLSWVHKDCLMEMGQRAYLKLHSVFGGARNN